MQRSTLLTTILGSLLLIVQSPAFAISIDVLPQAQEVTDGTSFNVDIAISGLGDTQSPSLSTYDLDLAFDTSVLSFSSVVFGNQLDVFGLGDVTAVDSSVSGLVNLYELSLDLPSDLDASQLPAFTLATLTFDAVGTGVSALSITKTILGDSIGDPLTATVQDASVIVTSKPVGVPEPGTLLLFVLGLVGLVRFKTTVEKGAKVYQGCV